MVHEGLVFEFSLETSWIAKTIPWLDADKGCILLEGTPEGNDGGAEVDGDLGLACLVEQLGTMYLTLVDLYAVVAPCVVAELDDAILSLYRNLNHFVRAVDIALQSIEGLLIVEADAAVLVLACFHIGDVEGGVTTNLEVYFLSIGIVDMPDNPDLIVIERIADREGEVVGIDFLGLCARFEGEGYLAWTLEDELEVCVACETMARQMIFLAINRIGVVIHATHDGEEDGGVAWPEFGIGLPQIFLTIGIFDALELGSFLRNDDGELFVFKFYHVYFVLEITIEKMIVSMMSSTTIANTGVALGDSIPSSV